MKKLSENKKLSEDKKLSETEKLSKDKKLSESKSIYQMAEDLIGGDGAWVTTSGHTTPITGSHCNGNSDAYIKVRLYELEEKVQELEKVKQELEAINDEQRIMSNQIEALMKLVSSKEDAADGVVKSFLSTIKLGENVSIDVKPGNPTIDMKPYYRTVGVYEDGKFYECGKHRIRDEATYFNMIKAENKEFSKKGNKLFLRTVNLLNKDDKPIIERKDISKFVKYE